MSNTIRYDALLVRHLAHELHGRLAGQPVRGLSFHRPQRELRLVMETAELQWSLQHWPCIVRPASPTDDGLALLRKARVQDIQALPDERVLRINLAGGARNNATAALVVELVPPQANVIVLDAHDRVLKLLAPNVGRRQMRGQPYRAPDARARAGSTAPLTLDTWLALLQSLPPDERAATFITTVAYGSPINAQAVLGSAARESGVALEAAYARYLELTTSTVQPCVLPDGQPYGHNLWQQATTCASLLEAFERAAATSPDRAVVQRIDDLLVREQKKQERLRTELEQAAQEAQRLRADADLLLALGGSLERSAEVELTDFEGQQRRISLDPGLSSTANAQRMYAAARKRERARQQLPALIEEAERRIHELRQDRKRALAGIDVVLPERPQRTAGTQPEVLPYRRYRTAGGLEVRVGRNRQANDALTLHHSAPDDIWLHARAVGGAHVVLRWPNGRMNPPRHDLEQAAALAALHSKARHSGLVAVDWTRRKYVRKPRGAPAGAVRMERGSTLFVAPDERLLEMLRWPD